MYYLSNYVRALLVTSLSLGLVTVASAQLATSNPQLFLNHFFIVVDEDTFEDIQSNDYLKDTFAVTESRTTTRNDAEYSGFYVYGENTYFEVLTKSESSWQSGIFLSGDHEESLANSKHGSLSQLYVVPDPITRQFDSGQVPWFYIATNFGYPRASALGMGIMQYHPDYLSRFYPEHEPMSRGVSRKEVLTRYASIVETSQQERLFQDVTGISVTATEQERVALVRIFEALDYLSRKDADSRVLNSDHFELRVSSATNSSSKINEVRMKLNREIPEEMTLYFGSHSRLKISASGEAIWSF